MAGLSQIMEFTSGTIEDHSRAKPRQKSKFVADLRVQLVGGGVIAAGSVSYGLGASLLTQAYLFPTVSGSSLLAGYGILATLSVAIQVMARGINPDGKLANPTGAWMTRALASLVLFGSMALAVLGILGSFAGPLDLTHQFPAVDIVRLAGCTLFSALIALPAAEARILTEALPEQQQAEREEAIEKARRVLLSYPGMRPEKPLLWFQWLVLLVPVPAAAGWVANLFWKGNFENGITLGLVAATSQAVLFPLIRRTITALHSDQHVSIILCALGCASLIAGPVALSLASVSPVGVPAAFALATAMLVPLTAMFIFCLPSHGKDRQRGIVLQSALKSTVRELQSLRQAGETVRAAKQREFIVRRVSVVATWVLCLPVALISASRLKGRADRT